MVRILLPSTLRAQVAGRHEVEVNGARVADALRQLETQYPSLGGWVLDERGALRPHVSLFRGSERIDEGTALAPGDAVHIIQAISGGAPQTDPAPDATEQVEVLVGTRKGLYVLRRRRQQTLTVACRHFAGQSVDFACRDPRTGRYFVAVSHGHFGPRLFFADELPGTDPSSPTTGESTEWRQCDGPTFPEHTGVALDRLWTVVPGEEDGTLWAGVAPAALFRSRDDGRSWALVQSLWDVPGRETWEGGLGGLCLHSICPWPGDPRRLAVGISAAGVWITEDDAVTWRRGGAGLIPRYLPEEARDGSTMLCVHNMHRAAGRPESLYLQFHGGVYRSDDGGGTWRELSGGGSGLPADFGFPLVAHPRDPDCAYVIPLISDEDRVTPDGRLRVFATHDGGRTWQSQSQGLPQEDAHLTILRQAFCHDGGDPLGLYFGATSGEVFMSADGGRTWQTAARRLPPVLSVRCGTLKPRPLPF